MSDHDRRLDERAERGDHLHAAIDRLNAHKAQHGRYPKGEEETQARYHLNRRAAKAKAWLAYKRIHHS